MHNCISLNQYLGKNGQQFGDFANITPESFLNSTSADGKPRSNKLKEKAAWLENMLNVLWKSANRRIVHFGRIW